MGVFFLCILSNLYTIYKEASLKQGYLMMK
ncbi:MULTISPECIES: DUF1563 domain-containing protein [Floricoccus]|nr:DUF1563 domain-containing protein [Floricoccus penangensis]